MNIAFIRRIGPDPHEGGRKSSSASGCPDLLELEGGDFAVIGVDITQHAAGALPPSAGCGPDERIVRIPRSLILGAQAEISALS
jgi:hypothetical protein